MAISKVTLNGTTLMDATTATAAAGDVIAPKTAMLKNGVVTTGTGTAPTGTKSISITENGTTTEDVAAYANAEITVDVPNPSSGSLNISANGTYDVTEKAEVVVNVSGGGGGGSDLASLEIYVADFLTDPPTVTDGAFDGWHRTIVA